MILLYTVLVMVRTGVTRVVATVVAVEVVERVLVLVTVEKAVTVADSVLPGGCQ